MKTCRAALNNGGARAAFGRGWHRLAAAGTAAMIDCRGMRRHAKTRVLLSLVRDCDDKNLGVSRRSGTPFAMGLK
jgi:hypothetical protein